MDVRALAIKLADSSPAVRRRGLKQFHSRIHNISQLTDDQIHKLWKGLFFAMWHAEKADRPREIGRRLSDVVSKLEGDAKWKYMREFWRVISERWSDVDYFRMDKYMSLVRYFVEEFMEFFLTEEENDSSSVSEMIRDTLLTDHPSVGLVLHVLDVFLESLLVTSSRSEKQVDPDTLLKLLLGFPIDVFLFKNIPTYTRLRERCKKCVWSVLFEWFETENETLNSWKWSPQDKKKFLEGIRAALIEVAGRESTLESSRSVLYELSKRSAKLTEAMNDVDSPPRKRSKTKKK